MNLALLTELADSDEFKATYGAPGRWVLYEFAKLWPMFAERGSLIMDVSLTGARWGGRYSARGRAVAAMTELLRHGILKGEDQADRGRARITGFSPKAMPPHPAFSHKAGDFVERGGRVREVVAVLANGDVESRWQGQEKTRRWFREKWRRWAIGAWFCEGNVMPAPIVASKPKAPTRPKARRRA